MSKLDIVTACGRGEHLAPPCQDQALCMRPVMARTGREANRAELLASLRAGGARTRHLCVACGRALAQAGGQP
jgi:hypothetical protein